jgi:hypothetical protein
VSLDGSKEVWLHGDQGGLSVKLSALKKTNWVFLGATTLEALLVQRHSANLTVPSVATIFRSRRADLLLFNDSFEGDDCDST